MPRGHMMADVFWMQFVCAGVRPLSDVSLVHVFIRVRLRNV